MIFREHAAAAAAPAARAGGAARRRAGPALAGLALALPETRIGQEETIRELSRLFPDEKPGFIAGIVRNSGVVERRLALPPRELLALRDFTERNDAWRRAATDLGARAAREALAAAGLRAAEVDAIVDVSCTGFAIPALDVHLAPQIGLRPDCLRLPVSAAGCAGGALGLGLAASLADGRNVLLVAVELCTLAFVPSQGERASLIAGALFGDGAAAAVLAPGGRGPRVAASRSHLFPDTVHAMGFAVGTSGLQIRLDRSLPDLLRRGLRPVVEDFLREHGLAPADVGAHYVHTGGRRVLDVYEEIFGLPAGGLAASRRALARYGNLSSASIFTVLREAEELGARPPRGQAALCVAFGPGLSVEMSLLEGFEE